MRNSFLVFFFFWIPLSFSAQPKTTDSLLKALDTASSDSSRIELLVKTSFHSVEENPTKALEYAQEALSTATVMGNDRLSALALNQMGNCFQFINKPDEAKTFYEKALQLNEKNKYWEDAFKNYNNLGSLLRRMNRPEEALTFFQKAQKLTPDLVNSPEQLAVLHNNFGQLYYIDLEDIKKSLSHFLASLDLFKGINSDNSALASANVGSCYIILEKYDSALFHLQFALKKYEQSGQQFRQASILNNLGQVYRDMGQYNKALEKLKKSLEIRSSLKDSIGMGKTLHATGETYETMGNYQEAIIHSRLAMELLQKRKRYSNAKNACISLFHSYHELGNYQKALEVFMHCSDLKDSLNREDTRKKIAELNLKYENEKEELELEKLRSLKKAQDLELEQKNLTIKLQLISGLTLLLILVLFFSYRLAKRKKNFEEELSKLRTLKQNQQEPPKEKASDEKTTVESKTIDQEAITVTSGDRILLIKLEDIVYFKAEDRYVFLFDNTGKKYIVDYTLTSIEKELPSVFIRIHRSFTINKTAIKEIRKGFKSRYVFVMNDTKNSHISSSQSYFHQIKDAFRI